MQAKKRINLWQVGVSLVMALTLDFVFACTIIYRLCNEGQLHLANDTWF